MKIDKDKLPQQNVTKISVEIIYNIESFYLNKSLYYSNELYSLFPPLGFISNYRIMLGHIKIEY